VIGKHYFVYTGEWNDFQAFEGFLKGEYENFEAISLPDRATLFEEDYTLAEAVHVLKVSSDHAKGRLTA
jgi:hypothetical protein